MSLQWEHWMHRHCESRDKRPWTARKWLCWAPSPDIKLHTLLCFHWSQECRLHLASAWKSSLVHILLSLPEVIIIPFKVAVNDLFNENLSFVYDKNMQVYHKYSAILYRSNGRSKLTKIQCNMCPIFCISVHMFINIICN